MDDLFAPTRHKLDVDAYYRMAEAGILTEDDRVELIDGELIDMGPIGEDHACTVNRLTHALVLAVGERGIVSVQNPVRLDRMNEPQPDFVVARARADWYRTAHPGPADVLLLVEVADSSVRFDRRVKLPLYARAGIAEVWIVDLGARRVEGFSAPVDGTYTAHRTLGAGEHATLVAAPTIRVPIERLFD